MKKMVSIESVKEIDKTPSTTSLTLAQNSQDITTKTQHDCEQIRRSN
jgi:hypothetical protein